MWFRILFNFKKYGTGTVRLQYGTVTIRYGNNTVQYGTVEYGTVRVRVVFKSFFLFFQNNAQNYANNTEI